MKIDKLKLTEILSKLGVVLGLEDKPEIEVTPEVVLAEEPIEEAKPADDVGALKAEIEALKVENEELKSKLAGEQTEKEALATQLSEIENSPADKKVTLTAAPVLKTKGQIRLESLKASKNL